MKKRILSMLMAIVMVVSLMPTVALAAYTPGIYLKYDRSCGSVTATHASASEGTEITIKPTPHDNYGVKTVEVTSRYINPVVSGPDANGWYTFVMPSQDVDVKVDFAEHARGIYFYGNNTNPVLKKGETTTLKIAFMPATVCDETVTWESSNPSVATVDNTGKVTAVAPGTATITVTTEDGGHQDTCNVTVKEPYTITKTPPTNGTFTVKVSGREVISAAQGDTVTIAPAPSPGYEVESVTVTKANGDPVAVYNNRFTMPAEAVTVSVTFRLLIHQHILCQTNGCTLDHNGSNAGAGHSDSDKVEFTAVSTYDDLESAAKTGGSVYLANNIELTKTITVASGKTLNLCLNGHTISPDENFTDRAVSVSGTLNLTDCGTTGAITGFTLVNSGGAGVFVTGTFIMYDGTISNNTETQGFGGGGVYVRSNGTFAMYGGTISGNTTRGSGGGVAGTVTMTGGTISDNTASGSGGGVAGTVTMTGGCIENNTATNGGSSVSGSLKISGSPKISGDVYLDSREIITITGPLDLPQGYETIPVYSAKNEQHVKITAGASTNGVITNGTQSIFVPKDTVYTRFHVHDGEEVCQVGRPTVTFDAKGGSPTPVTQSLDLDGGKATEPTEAPTKTACVFSHWCNNEGCTDYTCDGWDFNTVITESMTLYAIWEPFTITVTSEPGKFTAVANPSPANIAYQWYKVIESDTGFTVTPEFLNDGNGFDRYGCSYTDSKWMANDGDYFNRRFMIYMNSGDTLTMTFDSAPGTMLMYGCNLGTFTSVAQSGESNTYVFTAPQGDGGTTTRDIYVLLFFGEAPAMTAVYNGTAFEAVEDQDDDNASLNTAGLPSGRYVCKVTWAEPTQDNYAGIYALSAPVSYTATYSGTSFPSNTTSKTEKNEDGSTTTTTTNKTTGAVTETIKTADGTTATTVTDKNGNITEVSAKVSASAASAAEKAGEPVTVPVELPAAKSSEEALPVKVDVPTGGATVEIPVEDVTPGTVVVIVNKDGTEQVVRTSSVSEDGVVVKLEKDATVKVVDMSRDFKDVHPVNHWATDAIDFVSARGIFNGTSTETFTPNGSMTRQAMWMTLARMSGEEPADMAAAREWAVENEVSDGSNPLGTVTRQQYVAMLWRWAAAEGMNVSVSEESSILGYIDADKISDYAAEAFRWASSKGIVDGYDDGTIRALTNASRAHAAAMMMRFCASTVN